METDWKKKYDEALERMKYVVVLPENEQALQALKETVFPELRESEDEKMEKAIVDALLSHCNSINLLSARGYQIEDVKAWLEKQKEMPTNEEMLRTLRLEYEKGVADTIAKYEQKEQKPIARENDFVSKPKTSAEILKHYLVWAENSEEDCPYTWKELADAIKDGIAALEQKPPIAGNDFGWIDELKHDLEHPEELDQKVDDVLKQRKERSLEWSEEDETIIDCAVEVVEKAGLPSIAASLKSLRPSWKPSEEQMKALNAVNCYGGISYAGQQNHLISLYNDLKKLM